MRLYLEREGGIPLEEEVDGELEAALKGANRFVTGPVTLEGQDSPAMPSVNTYF